MRGGSDHSFAILLQCEKLQLNAPQRWRAGVGSQFRKSQRVSPASGMFNAACLSSRERIIVRTLLLTQTQFQSRLFGLSKATAVGMTAVTVPEMRAKENPFFGRVVKVSRVNGFINWRYARTVNRQRTREDKTPDFAAVPRSWGHRVKGTPLVALVTAEGQTLLYLEIKVQMRSTDFRDRVTGELIGLRDVKPYLIPPAKAVRQQIDRDIVLRDFRLDHIAELRIDAQAWRVRKCWNLYQRLTRSLFSGAVA